MLGERWINWLFRPSRPQDSAVQGQPLPGPALDERLREIESQLRDVALIRLEWTEVLDKLQAWSNRQNARDAKRVKAGIGSLAESPEVDPEPTNAPGPSVDPAQVKIALRKRLQAQNGGHR